MPNVLITGANRGIGLELTRQYAKDGWQVFACCRTPSQAEDLRAVEGKVSIHALDVADARATERLAKEIDAPLDVVIANAGVYGPGSEAQTFGRLDLDGLRDTIETNTIGTLRTLQAFLPHVKRSERRKLVAITSQMGSIEDASGGSTAYRVSKTALNMAVAVAAAEVKSDGVAMAILHPGWVRTDMGGPSGKISPEESAEGLRRVIDGLTPSDKAPFLTYAGKTLPW